MRPNTLTPKPLMPSEINARTTAQTVKTIIRAPRSAYAAAKETLPQFQGRQRKQRKHQRRNPEAHNHLRLRPAQQFEVMVNRRHLENAFLAQLVRTDLQYHRQRLDNENPSDEGQQQFMFDHHSNRADGSAQRQRTHVAHEYLGRMCVIPEKSNRRPDHRPAKNRKLPDLWHALQFQINRKSGVAAEVGKNRQRSSRNHRTTYGETIKTIGKTDGVARSDNDEHNERHKRQKSQRPELSARPCLDHQIRVKLFKEWDEQHGRILSAVLQSDEGNGNQGASPDLVAQFGTRGQSQIAAMNDFQIIVGKADRTEGQRGKDRDPDKRIAQIRPKHRRHKDGDSDQQATHRRRARLFLMSLRAFFSDVLPDLKIAQAINHDRPDNQAREKRGEAGESSTKSQIPKDAEWRKVMKELQVEQPVEQSASDTRSRFSVLTFQLSFS